MLTVAVFPNVSKPQAPDVLRRIFDFYQDKDVRLILPIDESRFFDCEAYGVADIEKVPADIALSLGGDGTLLGMPPLWINGCSCLWREYRHTGLYGRH